METTVIIVLGIVSLSLGAALVFMVLRSANRGIVPVSWTIGRHAADLCEEGDRVYLDVLAEGRKVDKALYK